jgi:heptosyltransferase-1
MFATPVVRALRERFPDAHLAWVVEPAASDVVEYHPELDEVIVWDRARWKRLARERRYRELWRAFREFRERLRARRFDLAIDMQGLLRSGLVAWFTRAPVRISLGPQEGSGLLATHRYPTGRAIEGMSAEPKLMAEWLGLDTSDWALELHLAPDALEGARARLEEAGIAGAFILLVPFTTRPWKHWVERRWPKLGAVLKEAFGLPVVLVGGPADREAADRIVSAAGGGLVDLVGKTSLTEALAVVSDAALVIGVDTALTHAAHAFLRPTVCVFGPAGYSDPPTPMSRMLHHWLDCVPCRAAGTRMVCGGAYTCMDLISVQEVAGHARALLDRYPPARPAAPLPAQPEWA